MSLKLSLEHRMNISQSTPATMLHRSKTKDLECHNMPVQVARITNCT